MVCGLLYECVLMVAKGYDHPEEIVEMGVAFVIGDAFGFYDE